MEQVNILSQVLSQMFRFRVFPFRAQYIKTLYWHAKTDVFPAETSETEIRLGLPVRLTPYVPVSTFMVIPTCLFTIRDNQNERSAQETNPRLS